MNDIRLFFKKVDRAKYISHLDLNRLMQRALRRAALPIWQTEGFNPHPYITFALPLALGTEGLNETMDTRLTEDMDLSVVISRLNGALPEDVQITRAAAPKYKHTMIAKAEYTIDTDCNLEKFKLFIARPEIFTEKITKKGISVIDLKPHINLIDVAGSNIDLILPAGTEFSINPGLVFEAFQKAEHIEINKLNICRTAVYCKNGSIFE